MAWWTYYGMWFASRLPGARVVALEPDPLYLDVGRRNVALNGLTEVTHFVHGAIAELNPAPDLSRSSARARRFRSPRMTSGR